jgi:hypothetical protein
MAKTIGCEMMEKIWAKDFSPLDVVNSQGRFVNRPYESRAQWARSIEWEMMCFGVFFGSDKLFQLMSLFPINRIFNC